MNTNPKSIALTVLPTQTGPAMSDDNRIQINEENRKIIEEIFNLYLERMGQITIRNARNGVPVSKNISDVEDISYTLIIEILTMVLGSYELAGHSPKEVMEHLDKAMEKLKTDALNRYRKKITRFRTDSIKMEEE